jgi:simple sugar transport system ATP-binding protein
MRGIVKEFPNILANDKVDFFLDGGKVHALVGENGAGKTTLMRIMFGMYRQDEGEILIAGKRQSYTVAGAQKLGIAMVHQNFMQIPQMSVLENIILGHAPQTKARGIIDYKSARTRIQKLLQDMGMKLNPDMLVQRLSVGERQKVEIIKALYIGARILIFDEPTAVLTPQESGELFKIINQLKSEGKAIAYISHKLNEVTEIADMATVMRRGKVVDYMTRESGEMTRVRLATSMVGQDEFEMVVSEKKPVGAENILEVKNLWASDPHTQSLKIKGLNFSVAKGEILGIGGVEGNGQQELIELIWGATKQLEGEISLDGKDISHTGVHERREAGLGYISEDRMITGVSAEASIQENIVGGKESSAEFSRAGLLRNGAINDKTLALIDQFDIRGGRLNLPVKSLSGGNMQKVILAREISRNPKLLIAAHPTRGLDIGAINFVREQLIAQKEKDAAVLLITADLEELLALSDRILVMYEGEFSGEVRNVSEESIQEIGLLMGGIVKDAIAKENGGKHEAEAH